MLNINANINGARKGLPYSTAGLQVIVYNSTYEEEGTTYLRTSIGVGIPKVSGTGLDTIWDFSVLNDARFDKGSYVGNAYGLPEYYDYPYVNIYYDDTSEATRYHWKLTDFHYRWLEAQSVGLSNVFFGKLIYTDEALQNVDRILIYENILTDSNLIKIKNYCIIREFTSQNYYLNEWLFRNDCVHMLVNNSDTISFALNGINQTIYWGDGTSEAINSDATYAKTYNRVDYFLINITKNITKLNISSQNITINGGEISQLTSLTYLYLRNISATINGGEISQLTSLTYLYLYNISATINGGEISQLTSLTTLYLYNISATINGGEISQLTSLTYLYLLNISATINGGEISQLTSLTLLYLIDISATINDGEISQLTSLTSLYLGDISATINGGEISQLTSLTYLYLRNISATINGGEISQLTSLTYLYLRNISATINGGEISQLTSLTYLYLYNISATINSNELFTDINISIINSLPSSTITDNLLIALDALGFWNNILTATDNPARTSASDVAYNSLIGKGATINL
jgi:Leucine-rich repeat (LRR) protein